MLSHSIAPNEAGCPGCSTTGARHARPFKSKPKKVPALMQMPVSAEKKTRIKTMPPPVPCMQSKMLVPQSLYNLSGDQAEYQVQDRLSFQCFLGLSAESTAPYLMRKYQGCFVNALPEQRWNEAPQGYWYQNVHGQWKKR